MIVTGPRDILISWLCSRIGYVPTPHMTCIASVEKNEIKAVVGYDMFSGKSCQMHIAGTGKLWMTRELLYAAFDYPFRQLDYSVVLGVTDSSNADAIHLNNRLGFTEFYRVQHGHPSGDLVMFEMRKPDCKWLLGGKKWQRNQQSHPADSMAAADKIIGAAATGAIK